MIQKIIINKTTVFTLTATTRFSEKGTIYISAGKKGGGGCLGDVDEKTE